MSKHTPGPWHAGKLRYPGADPRFNGIDIGADSGENIALVYFIRDEHTREECAANGRLIAAAPELYEALRGMMDAYMDLCDEADPNYRSYKFRESKWEAARAVLAKVDGCAE